MDSNRSEWCSASLVFPRRRVTGSTPEMSSCNRFFHLVNRLCLVICFCGGEVNAEKSVNASVRAKIEAQEPYQAVEEALMEIAKVERKDRYAPELADLYELVGDAAIDMKDSARAISAYDQALFHKRITFGLSDPAQLDLVGKQIRFYIENNKLRDATDRMEYAYQVATRSYGSKDVRIKETLLALAEWYKEIRYPQIARRLYERLAEIEKIKGDELNAANLQHQMRMAETYYLQAFPLSIRVRGRPLWQPRPYGYILPESTLLRETTTHRLGPGNTALKKAVDIAMEVYGEHSTEHLEALLKLADWRLAFKLWRQAFGSYKEIWDVLAEKDPQYLNQVFGQPVSLYDVRPGTSKRMFESMRENRTERGQAEYSYSISRKGVVEDLVTLRKIPEDFDTYGHRRALAKMRFRPAFVEGEPVAYLDQRRVIRFFY